MRIVGGRHRGRRLDVPPGRDIRPTTDRIRQAVFDILDHWVLTDDPSPVAGARVLDACCGTGAMGLEALSRGAAHCTFFDTASAALAVVRRNAEALRETTRVETRHADAANPPPPALPCGLLFLDPPYRSDLAAPVLTALARRRWLASGAVVVLETARTEDLDLPEGFALLDERIYGDTRIRFAVFDPAAPCHENRPG